MKRLYFAIGLLAASPAFAQHAHHADAQRHADVAERGAAVMPFDLASTTHVFTKTATGGIQRVVAKNGTDATQVNLIRDHLRDIQARFLQGDFSGPAHIHGAGMPGLSRLRAAKPGQLAIDYRDVKGGAELEYKTKDRQLAAAIHEWFDAQLSDHGRDAVEGHVHSHHH
ncbi:hypothetical protein [Noviherbaspirillum massiliense]|uniref:hypothetical protein n=1 Tax=Noviherbaspirillum massiliense TaxID=1465823 RepID=UPI00031A69E1|nr:hypothetical protein [Noviherbaspirillum massiliense]